jgi:hypothetical protein
LYPQIELEAAAEPVLRRHPAEVAIGRVHVGRGEVGVVGGVQQVRGEVDAELFGDAEAAQDLDVPVADAVGAQRVQAGGEDARMELARLRGGAAVEALKAGGDGAGAAVGEARVEPEVDVA